ncbi:MAG: hypothetical protein HKN79_08795 [Flavobacteriales bacterium]|nr:hypothetical protein [Flavobacteriales bacterium]
MRVLIISLAILISSSLSAQEGLPRPFQEADINGDGFIAIPEVQRMIDGFFIGTHDHGVMYIHTLIDFFFEQPYNAEVEAE